MVAANRESKDYDVIIMGSGPAGLQAAVHAARAKVSVAVLGRLQKSSLFKAHIENYCCMENTITGQDVLEQGRRQAERFGAEFLEVDVLNLGRDEEGRVLIETDDGRLLRAGALILAMGVARNRLNVPGEKEYLGKGVSYCVECDANFFREQPVVVVGNESAAASGALHMLMVASEVHLVYSDLAVSDHLKYQIEQSGIVLHPGKSVKAIEGDGGVSQVVLDGGEVIQATGVFIELGAKGALELATRLDILLDSETMKFIAANRKQETNVPGVYAAGDICGPPWQMAKAVGEGCVAGLEAASYAKKVRRSSEEK